MKNNLNELNDTDIKEQIQRFIGNIRNQPYFLNMSKFEKNLLIVNYIVNILHEFYSNNNIIIDKPKGMEITDIASQINLSIESNRKFNVRNNNSNVEFKTNLNERDVEKLLNRIKKSMPTYEL